ncbi:MAG: acyl-CoA dehydrogenase family protein [Chloroflexi bacterium]|nr:acyl-CoA dehydrogenase family protein [Chloroflexota bacterium]
MDFEPRYTPEQQEFRREVRAWLDEHVPKNLPFHADSKDTTYEEYLEYRALGRKLGDKGWLWPTAPVEYGGGGLTIDHAIVIEEELDRHELSLPPYYDSGGRLGGASILVWGTEEQKRRFLPPIFKGEARTWQLLTEPGAGSDLAAARISAVRDGDDYVINGQKIFVGSAHGAEQLWMIACTDPDGERHHNLSWFIVHSDLPGITIQPMDLLIASGESGASSGVKNTVYFDNVRVPAFNLVGGENNGWKVATTHLELEHGSGGTIRRNRIVERLFEAARQLKRDGKPLSQHPDIQDLLVDVYIEAEIGRLFGLRNYWMSHTRQRLAHEGPQHSYWRKESGLRMAEAIQKALGPYALTNDPALDGSAGSMEVFQRAAIVALHPGGTGEIQKVIMARRLGIGRAVREQAGTLA